VGGRGRGVTGGSVRVRPGTRSRIGRSYRIRRSYGHGYRYSYGYHHRPYFGFYYSWSPYTYPYYYDAYPSYGLYFGYGLSYYGPSYATTFVDATDYNPGEVIVSEEIIDEPAPAPEAYAPGAVIAGPQTVPVVPPVEEDFPAPAPQAAAREAAPQAAGPAAGSRKPHPDFDPAVKDFLAGRYESSLRHLDNVIRAEPDNGEAWLAAMHANFALGRYALAGNALAKAAALDAFPRGYRFDPRPLYAKTGNFDRAVKALEAHITRKPDDVDALLVRAYLHVTLGERTQAQDQIQRVLQMRPGDATAPALALALLPPPPPPQQPQPQPVGPARR